MLEGRLRTKVRVCEKDPGARVGGLTFPRSIILVTLTVLSKIIPRINFSPMCCLPRPAGLQRPAGQLSVAPTPAKR